MNKIVRSIMYAPDELSLKVLLNDYHKSNVEFQSFEQNRSDYLLLIELIEQEYKHYDEELKRGTESISLWLGSDEVRISQILDNLKYSKQFFLSKTKEERKSITFDELPDYLTDEDLSRLFGWEPTTIASKRSRGEIPRVDGFQLTPKAKLIKLLEAKTVEAKDASKSKEDAVQAKVNSFRTKK